MNTRGDESDRIVTGMAAHGRSESQRASPDSAVGAAHHELPVHEVVLLLETDAVAGLSTREAASRLARFGRNTLPAIGHRGPLVRFLLQFNSPLIYILLAASAATLTLGHLVDAAVILGVVVVNAIVGFVQESHASNALQALVDMTQTRCSVVRDGQPKTLSSDLIVPGDVVILEAGDKVPADIRLTAAAQMRVDESALTGESVPVGKHASPVAPNAVLSDRLNMAYSSTLVTSGQGRGVVVATGADTEIGRIHRLIGTAEGVETPLTRKLASFSKWLTVIILLLAAATFALGILRGESAGYMVTAAVALAVGAIPEGLPAAVTITLAIGVTRMARRRAIIRTLSAAETLGSTTVICTDKTGTLTENQMTVQVVVAAGGVYEVTGTGFGSVGEFHIGEHRVDLASHPSLASCLEVGALCNDAQLIRSDAGQEVLGDPTEVALLVAAEKAGINLRDLRSEFPRKDVLPFESERRYMATLHEPARGEIVEAVAQDAAVLMVKGAAEQVLDLCMSQLNDDGSLGALDVSAILSETDALAERALRVLAFASVQVPAETPLTHETLASASLTFLGLQAMNDPPRPEVITAVRSCHEAGIAVKMITGDHGSTARAIAVQIGLTGSHDVKPQVITGAELAAFSTPDLPGVLARTQVFARVSAEQKLRIVQGLQQAGSVVAMTGDGVNDAPALKQSDIGVAMGMMGTEVAKESADMILVDDNFATIESAVEEGRGLFDNLTKFITWTLPTNFGEGLVILAAIAAGSVLPILPVQILWINMTTAVALGLMLAFEPREPGIMSRPPRTPNEPILTKGLLVRIVMVSMVMLAGAYGLFAWDQANGGSLEQSRTVAVNTFVVIEIFYLFNCRSLRHSILHVGLFTNRAVLCGVAAMLGLQLALTYIPAMNALFHTAPIPPQTWIQIVAVGLLAYGIVGTDKWLRRHLPNHNRA